MVRHTSDNDKKPRPRQGAGDRPRRDDAGKAAFDKRPGGKPGPRDKTGAKGAGSRGAGSKGAKPDAKAEAPLRQERIAKVMARAGYASRREVERLIGLGRVAVNGRILDTPATLVTREDKITVDGKPIGSAQSTRVWRYHKPVGLLTTHNDPQGRPTVFDALPSTLPRTISVGRLDINSEGLLLLTNDGELSRALEMPTTGWVRQYRARARGRITQEQLDRLKDGAFVDGVRYGPMEATLDKVKTPSGEDEKAAANLWVSVSIAEGKNREVRKVLESVGLKVNRLIRLAYGPFQLGTLPVGAVEEVGPRVIRELLAEHIRPENLPTGDTVETPAPIPGRRVQTSIVKGKSGSAMSDPSRKPSRVRAAAAASTEAAERADRPQKKPGWAKAAPRPDRPKRPFKPREGAEGERPQRTFKPRDGATRRDGEDRPKRPFKPRGEGGGDRPRSGPARSGPARSGPPRGGPGRPGGGGGDKRPGPGGGSRPPRPRG
ncbi:pseudouridine synthase [Brevundimonas balnearis]|uniref:Pseudouridine synthase n=1 Tax=Brevundimonas balnearis TaxID=1572858 RepID=A0ABV6QZ11_9CAUL